jgi:tetratricopeptide (TPR) repeat protein
MRKLIFALIILGVLVLLAGCVFVFWYYPERIRPMQEYRAAVALYEKGNYVPAALQFESMNGLAESAEYAKRAWIAAGNAAFDAGDLAQARTYFLKGGADSATFEKLDASYYQSGVRAYAENDRVEGENCFSCISSGSRYLELLDPVRISCAERFIAEGDYDQAEKVLKHCGEGSDPVIEELWTARGRELLTDYELDGASYCFARAMAYAEDVEKTTAKFDSYFKDAGDRARQEGNYELANKCFARMSGGSGGSSEQATNYSAAIAALSEGRSAEALRLFVKAGDFRDSQDRADELREELADYYAAGVGRCFAALSHDGKVGIGGDWGTYSSPEWYQMKAIAVGGERFMLGLKEDGTVVFHGNATTDAGQVSSWRNVSKIACGAYHSLALKTDGTVLASGRNIYGEVSGVEDWRGIRSIAAGEDFSVGVRNDGTVVYCGNTDDGRCAVDDWTGVSSIACGKRHTVGLLSDGTAIACGENTDGRCDVEGWSGLVGIYAGATHTVGLRIDGTLVACGSNNYGECSVENYTDVVSVACGDGFTLILLADGTEIVLGGY